MWHRPLSSAWGLLSKLVGQGIYLEHEDLQLTVTFKSIGGEGLFWPLVVYGHRCRAWCDEAAWCQWIEPIISVPEFRALDRELLSPLAQWSWTLVPPFMAGSALQVSAPEPGELESDLDPVLTLERGERKIAFRLLEWPEKWLGEQLAEWGPVDSATPLPVVGLPLVLGWVYIAGSELRQLRSGEGLLLRGTIDFSQGEAWLFHQRPLAKLHFLSPEEARVEATMKEQDQWPESAQEVGSIMVTIVVEIGRWNLPLASVAELKVGEIIRGDPSFKGEVRLTINGCTIGFATLLEVGGRWVARIEQLIGQWPFTPTVDDQLAQLPLVAKNGVGDRLPENAPVPEIEATEGSVLAGDKLEAEIESAPAGKVSSASTEILPKGSPEEPESGTQLPSATRKTPVGGEEGLADGATQLINEVAAQLPDGNLAVKGDSGGVTAVAARRKKAVTSTHTAGKKSLNMDKPDAGARRKRRSAAASRADAKGDI